MIKIEITSARNPQWANEERTAINCLVRTNTLLQEAPFTASPHDSEAHGKDLFARCLAGEFGAIAPMDLTTQQQALPKIEIPPKYIRLQRFIHEANLENSRKSFRSVVIVWGSLLDNLLDEVLEADALRSSAAGRVVDKPPSTLGARIKRAREAELIDQEDAHRLHNIRRIRNAAAHEWELSLATKDILQSLRALHQADHAQLVVFHEDLDFLLQQIYSTSCAMLVMKLIDRLPVESVQSRQRQQNA
jgi:hypothetical protein